MYTLLVYKDFGDSGFAQKWRFTRAEALRRSDWWSLSRSHNTAEVLLLSSVLEQAPFENSRKRRLQEAGCDF